MRALLTSIIYLIYIWDVSVFMWSQNIAGLNLSSCFILKYSVLYTGLSSLLAQTEQSPKAQLFQVHGKGNIFHPVLGIELGCGRWAGNWIREFTRRDKAGVGVCVIWQLSGIPGDVQVLELQHHLLLHHLSLPGGYCLSLFCPSLPFNRRLDISICHQQPPV